MTRSALVLLGALLCMPASAATINVSGCAQSAVQSALNGAASGDVVAMGAGTCTWSSSLTVNATARDVTLKGAGQGATTINASTGAVLALSAAAPHRFTVSDFTINASGVPSGAQALITVNGGSAPWRVHHLTITNTGNMLFVFTVTGPARGLIDHLNVSGQGSGLVDQRGAGAPAWWDTANGWGDANALFVEDNTIAMTDHHEGRLTVDCITGGRYVLRHNQITNQRTGNHGLDSAPVSCLSSEIYNNTWTYTTAWDTSSGVVFWRGGTSLIHDNVIKYHPQLWANAHFRFPSFRAGDGEHPSHPACNGTQYKFNASVNADWTGTFGFSTGGTQKVCSGDRMRLCTADGACSGAGSCSEFADGQGGSGAYPCFMQPGRGVHNVLDPIHIWNNTFTGGVGQGGVGCASGQVCDADTASVGAQVQLGRDVIVNTAKAGYTAYTYPHPLQQGSPPAPGTTPNPPTGITVTP